MSNEGGAGEEGVSDYAEVSTFQGRFIDFLYRREKFHFSYCKRNTNFCLLKIKFMH
jgi:hypothetical protein